MAAILVALLLTVRVADHPAPEDRAPAAAAQPHEQPVPPPAPPPEPSPPPPPDPATAAAAHGTADPRSVGALQFTCVRTGPDGAELSRRRWMFEPALRLITSLDEQTAYLADNVTEQLAPLDAAWRADSIWFLMPFRLRETKPDVGGAQLVLENGGPQGETAWISLDERGLIATIELGRDASGKKGAKLRVEAWLEFENAPGLKLPAAVVSDDGSRFRFEEASAGPAADPGEAEEPEPWPSVRDERPIPAPENEGG